MAHDISEAKARLTALEAAEKKRKHKKAAHDLGFDVTGDYDAWKVLDDPRTATLRARSDRAQAEKPAPKPTGGLSVGGGYITSTGGPWITASDTWR